MAPHRPLLPWESRPQAHGGTLGRAARTAFLPGEMAIASHDLPHGLRWGHLSVVPGPAAPALPAQVQEVAQAQPGLRLRSSVAGLLPCGNTDGNAAAGSPGWAASGLGSLPSLDLLAEWCGTLAWCRAPGTTTAATHMPNTCLA